MTDPFQVKAESKSWADMVEEEEEYERLLLGDDISDSSPSLQPAIDKSKEPIKEFPIEPPITKEVATPTNLKQDSQNDQCTPPIETIKEELKKEELGEPKHELEEPKQELEEPKQELEDIKEELKEEPKEEKPEVEEPKEEKPEEKELQEAEPKVVEELKEEKAEEETPKVETPEAVKEEEPEQVKEEPKKEAIKLLSGSKASRWASAPSDPTPPSLPPKVSRWERPANSSYKEPQKLDDSAPQGSSASKWASAPASKYGSNRSKYDSSSDYQDRYSSNYDAPARGGRLNRSTFEDSGRLNRSAFEDSGRLNRSAFEDSGRLNRSTFENDSFGSRNHYDRDFDRDDRNGGFDNKDNFRRGRKVEPLNEQEAESIKQWNAYQPPADENDPVKPLPPLVDEKKPLPVVVEDKKLPDVVDDEKKLPDVVDEKKPLPVVVEDKKLPDVVDDEKKLPDVVDKKLPVVQSPVKKAAVVQEKPSILDYKPAFSWADDIDNSDDDYDYYDMVLPKKDGNDWSSYEEVDEEELSALPLEPEIVKAEPEAKEDEPKKVVVEEIKAVKEPEAVEEPVAKVAETPVPTYTWGSLEEVPKKVVVEASKVVEEPAAKVAEEPVAAKVEEKPTVAPTYTWGSLEEAPTPQVVQAPIIHVSKEEEESALNRWNGFNKTTKPQQEAPDVEDAQTSDQVWEKYNPDTVQAPQSSTWNEEAAPAVPAWGTPDINAPATTVEKSGIKDTWKAKLPAVVEDNASGWKLFAETVTAVRPVVVEEQKKQAVPSGWGTVQEAKTSQEEIKFSLVDEERKPQENVTHTISLVDSGTKAPQTISLNLADFAASSSSSSSDKKAPQTISLSLADFNQPPKAPQNVSFSFSDLNAENGVEHVAMKWNDLVESPAPAAKEPKEISLKWSDIDQFKPRETAPKEVNLRWQDI